MLPRLDAVVAGIEPFRLTAFLLKRGQISEGQTYRNLSDAYVQRVLKFYRSLIFMSAVPHSGR